jgi:hypothetical protein
MSTQCRTQLTNSPFVWRPLSKKILSDCPWLILSFVCERHEQKSHHMFWLKYSLGHCLESLHSWTSGYQSSGLKTFLCVILTSTKVTRQNRKKISGACRCLSNCKILKLNNFFHFQTMTLMSNLKHCQRFQNSQKSITLIDS